MDAIVEPSPMMAAHAAAVAAAPGHLVLYRVGEFYEVLHGDALTASRALGIQLTRRRQKGAPDVPMCGIPASRSAPAIARLLAAGHKLAISEQPTEPDGKRPLRLLTPATSVDADVLTGERSNNLVVAHAEGDAVGFAFIDVSTGESGTCMASLGGTAPALARIGPAEILVSQWPEGSEALAIAVRGSGVPFSNLRGDRLGADDETALLEQAFGPQWREAMQGFSPLELVALTELLNYVRTTIGQLPDHLLPPRRAVMGDTMEIDAPTLRGLEVFTSGSGRGGALIAVLDRTVTPAGARLLVRQLAAPLTSPRLIERRLAMVQVLVKTPQLRSDCLDGLSSLPDLLRACGRLSLGKAGPRDLAAVRDALRRAAALTALLKAASDLPPALASVARDLGAAAEGDCGKLMHTLQRALVQQPPATIGELGFIADGFSSRVDAGRASVRQATEAIEGLQARYAADTGVKSLRIRTNSVIGYHVEVPAGSVKAIGDGFTLRQGLASTTRFSSPALDEAAGRLEDASAKVALAEEAAFTDLANGTLTVRDVLTRIAHAAAALDLVAGLAQAAAEGGWSRPDMTEDTSLAIEGGRHPVAERLLDAQGRSFVDNDCQMGAGERLWLITGPNMAGKSTFLRQVALIVLMAQVGSFVPARRARIGVMDKLFSRIGAADDLAAGRSTFLVEMLETAAILNGATQRSLVILDEVGRGTATHDGLAIAQACMENLHDEIGCRTLFATHYHELADAADGMDHATCMAMDASAGRHDDVFTYRVLQGRAGKSYGLKAAAMAGLPQAVLDRAAALMAAYEVPRSTANQLSAALPDAG